MKVDLMNKLTIICVFLVKQQVQIIVMTEEK